MEDFAIEYTSEKYTTQDLIEPPIVFAKCTCETCSLRKLVGAYEEVLVSIRSLARDEILKLIISRGITAAIHDHGPIDHALNASAAKRIAGQLLSYVDAELERRAGPDTVKRIKEKTYPPRPRR